MKACVTHATEVIHARYSEPLRLNDLAEEVFVSPFHFSRVFSRSTGLTPGRYLSAVRMFEAKRLLVTTAMTVSDVVCSVGYSSVGTFTSKFARTVGMSPSEYRDPSLRGRILAIGPRFRQMPDIGLARGATELRYRGGAARPAMPVTVRLRMPIGPATSMNLVVGVFSGRAPQSGPVAFVQTDGAARAEATIPDVPPGCWTIMAVAQRRLPDGQDDYLVGVADTMVVPTVRGAGPTEVRMRTPLVTDVPFAVLLDPQSDGRAVDVAA